MIVNPKRCSGCGTCIEVCPLNAIILQERTAVISEFCSLCGACAKVCPHQAISRPTKGPLSRVTCQACPIHCEIPEGYTGACHRYMNINNKVVRRRRLLIPQLLDLQSSRRRLIIGHPLVTGIGAGTKRGRIAGFLPAPYIVYDRVEDIDVVTCATEAPLSYCGLIVKIDTDLYIGEEGSKVLKGNAHVGYVSMEQYGSKTLNIGGVNLLTGKTGIITAKTISEILRGGKVELKIEDGAKVKLQIRELPVIDGQVSKVVKGGCGSSAVGLFAASFKEAADEVIILDSHVTGLASEHLAGEIAGMKYSGVSLVGTRSTRGRYFLKSGNGWGGTNIQDPTQAIAHIDMTIARPGMTVLITESIGQRAKMFTVTKDGGLKEIELTTKAKAAVNLLAKSCELSGVSALLVGGAGGEVRGGVTKYPIKLTQAVKEGLTYLTVGGAPTFILPGSGLTFLVDVEQVFDKAFTWVPTPAIVVPLEFTMEREVFEKMGGHIKSLKPKSDVVRLDEIEFH